MRKLTLFTLIPLVTMFMFSCKKSPKYSCDEGIEKYMATTTIDYQDISRNDLAQKGRDTQFAIFRSLTAANKKRIFNEKIDLLLSTETYTNAERQHLISLKNYFSDAMYGRAENNPDPFITTWENAARNQLGWSVDKIEESVGIWLTRQEINRNYLSPLQALSSCDCRYTVSCWWTVETCMKSGCTIPYGGGCGIVGTANCTGYCTSKTSATGI